MALILFEIKEAPIAFYKIQMIWKHPLIETGQKTEPRQTLIFKAHHASVLCIIKQIHMPFKEHTFISEKSETHIQAFYYSSPYGVYMGIER